MGERSVYGATLLTILTVAVCFGVYAILSNQDLVKRQEEDTQKALRTLTNEVRALRRSAEDGYRKMETRLGTEIALLREAAQSGYAGMIRNMEGGKGATPPELPPLPEAAGYANAEFFDPEAEAGGRRASYTSSFSGNINYLVNMEATVGDLWDLCLDPLGARNYEDVLRFEPVLARSWEVSDDGLVWTIRLRRDATWHPFVDPVTEEAVPARPVTADDYVFYWETLQNPQIPADPIRTYLSMVERIEKVDEHTIRVVWREPYSLAAEVTLSLTPLPRHYFRPDPDWSDEEFAEQMKSSPRNHFLVGCGAYRFTHWKKGKEIRLDRYEDYYGPKPPIRTLLIREIKTPVKALIEFKKGGLDRIGLTPDQWVHETKAPDFRLVTPDIETAGEDARAWDARKEAGDLPADYSYEKYQYRRFTWAYIGYNMRRPYFRDRRVRQALTHCVDRERIIQEVMRGFATLQTGPFVPQSPYYDATVQPYPFDLEKAKALLAEAGWTDTDGDGWLDRDLDGDGERTPFSFSFIIPSASNQIRKWATIIQQDMGKAGIQVHLKPIEWSVYTEMLDKGSYDVCSLLWSGGIESDPYQIWHSSQAETERGSNHVAFRSEEADRLIEEGRRTLDIGKRVEIYRAFHRLLHKEQPYTFLFCPNALVTQHRRYRNVRVFVSGMPSNILWVPAAEQVAP